MKTHQQQMRRGGVLAALGLAVLLGAPGLTQADQGKWWTPKQGGRAPVAYRPSNDRVRPGPGYGWRQSQGRGYVSWQPRWRGQVHQNMVRIWRGPRRHYFPARRVYFEPYYHRHVVWVRPVRFYLSADARIGPVDIHIDPYGRGDFLYGCNFCDERFDSYDGYSAHVSHCDARPYGYEVRMRDWEDDGRLEDWRD